MSLASRRGPFGRHQLAGRAALVSIHGVEARCPRTDAQRRLRLRRARDSYQRDLPRKHRHADAPKRDGTAWPRPAGRGWPFESARTFRTPRRNRRRGALVVLGGFVVHGRSRAGHRRRLPGSVGAGRFIQSSVWASSKACLVANTMRRGAKASPRMWRLRCRPFSWRYSESFGIDPATNTTESIGPIDHSLRP